MPDHRGELLHQAVGHLAGHRELAVAFEFCDRGLGVRTDRPGRLELAITILGARRVAAVQRALTQYGYGQLKATGAVGSDTQAAITKFERDRKLPVTGQMSDRLVRELTAMVGHPIE